jgi:DNA repair exonuclease SbcCD ATPase subunit
MVALLCFIMGFAIYIAFDIGMLRLGSVSLSKETPTDVIEASAVKELLKSNTKIARIKKLQDRIDDTESILRQRVETLEKMRGELQDFSNRLGNERKALNSVATMAFEIENEREKIVRERGVLTIGAADGKKLPLTPPLVKVAEAARQVGVIEPKIASVKWRDNNYLRLVNAFEFQSDGIYLRIPGIDKANAIANAIANAMSEEEDVSQVTVVYRDISDQATGDQRRPASISGEEDEVAQENVSHERALVLKNHFREVLGDAFSIRVSKIDNDLVAPGAVEVWVGSD